MRERIRRAAAAALVLGVVPFVACYEAPSLHPFLLETDAVHVNVAGTWIDKDGDVRLRFDEDGTRLELRGKDCPDDRDDCGYLLDVRFARFGGRLVADFIAHDGEGFGTWPVHRLARVDLADDTLTFSVLDGDWLEKAFDSRRLSLAHERVDGEVVLTAPTAELRRVLPELLAQPEAFEADTTFRRVAPKPAS